MKSEDPTQLEVYLDQFNVADEKLERIKSSLLVAFDRGLDEANDMYLYTPLKMLPTYITCVPDGNEFGSFVGIDLGGTNLRVLQIYVIDGKLLPISIIYPVPQDIMTGTKDDLFNFIADRIHEAFVKMGIIDKEVRYLGFTFSFPVNQKSLSSGYLLRWTKGFSVKGVVDNDVVFLLREACKRKSLKIKDYVLINDTTGTLLCGAFENKKTNIGIIVGTGTNACYLEDLDKVKRYKIPTHHKKIIINTEWGAFGDNGELDDVQTTEDDELDRNSINPGKQKFEKMISGMYLGEISRLIIVKIHKTCGIFKNEICDKFYEKYSLPTSLISYSCKPNKFEYYFKNIYNYNLDEKESEIMRSIFDVVVKRSANLCAAGIWALSTKLNSMECFIAVDGSLIKKHPKYIPHIEETLTRIGHGCKFTITVIDDGSGKGAALSACVATFAADKRGYQSS